MNTAIQLVASDILDIKTLNIDEVREIVKILTLRMDDEKQQIIDSFNQGYREGEIETITSSKEDVANFDDAKNYYNKTFKPKL